MDFMQSWKKIQQSFASPPGKSGILNYKVLWLGLVGILLIACGSAFDGAGTQAPGQGTLPAGETAEKAPDTHIYENQAAYTESGLEERLVRVLSKVKGAGRVSVNICFAGSQRREYAKNKTREKKDAEEKDTSGGLRTTTESKENDEILMMKEGGADKPLVVETTYPEVKGVLVVAEGAKSSAVKANLAKAVATGLGIASYKITVLPQ